MPEVKILTRTPILLLRAEGIGTAVPLCRACVMYDIRCSVGGQQAAR